MGLNDFIGLGVEGLLEEEWGRLWGLKVIFGRVYFCGLLEVLLLLCLWALNRFLHFDGVITVLRALGESFLGF